MTAPQETADGQARLDDLRRRLYRADATEADRRRYEDEVAAAPVHPEADQPRPAPPRTRRRIAVGIVVAIVAGTALTLGVRLGQPTTPPAPAPVAQVVQQDVGDGRVLSMDARSVLGPTPVATSIKGTAAVGQRFQGYGNAVVAFDLPADSYDGGRVLVAVTAVQPARVSWRALLVVTRQDWSSYPIVLARGAAEERSGAHAPTTFVYATRPPTRIAIEAPSTAGWTLVVAVTPTIAPVLH